MTKLTETSYRERMRVAHVSHTVADGGAEIALARLIESRPSWVPFLFVPKGSERDKMLTRAPFTAIFSLGPVQRPGLTQARFAGAVRFLSSIARHVLALCVNPEFRATHIVHANSSRAAVYATVASRVVRKPLVVHLRDAISVESLGKLGHLIMARFVLPSARGVIANSTYTLQTASEHVRSGAECRVIPSPVGVSRRTVLAVERDEIARVGMVARVAEWKGQALVLEAFSRAFRDSNVRLQFVGGTDLGGDDYLQVLHERALELGISDRVDFLGQVPNVQVEDLIDSFDICVQASIRPEPLGQNVLQYLARARPTIATAAGGPQEWIADRVNGRLFRLGSVDELAQRLDELKPKSEREALCLGAIATPLPTPTVLLEMHHELYTACVRA